MGREYNGNKWECGEWGWKFEMFKVFNTKYGDFDEDIKHRIKRG